MQIPCPCYLGRGFAFKLNNSHRSSGNCCQFARQGAKKSKKRKAVLIYIFTFVALYKNTFNTMSQEKIKHIISQSIATKQLVYKSSLLLSTLNALTQEIVSCYQRGGKVLFCGNGGSAADAQHLAAELSGRFYFDRPPLEAEALHVNTSYLTAVANDYSYDEVYARYLRAAGKKGDVLFGISTSGNSKNIVKALEEAKKKEMITVGMTGESGGKMKNLSDYLLNVPSEDTPRIQEVHILLGHIICELVEKALFEKK